MAVVAPIPRNEREQGDGGEGWTAEQEHIRRRLS